MYSERKLVTVEKILDVKPASNADALEIVKVRGWNVVVKKGDFQVGDDVLYFEIDSTLPESDPRFSFLMSKGVKSIVADGVDYRGHVLRTIKLRGNLSQGLVLPLSDFPEVSPESKDIAGDLGIVKYEPPIPANLSGQILGKFPSEVRKTDAERVQNLEASWDAIKKHRWASTEKIDGRSITLGFDGEKFRACSRNWELRVTDDLSSYDVAKRYGITDVLKAHPGLWIQAELAGPGIQGNKLGLSDLRLFIFNVIENVEYLPRSEWHERLLKNAVPTLPLELPERVSEAVSQVDGMKSSVSPSRLAEGVVWHTVDGSTLDGLDGRDCFKAINNSWLLKDK